jgi:hypothetical protein
MSLGTGTGFVVEHDGVRFLVTNRHVVRGRANDSSNANLHPSGAWPESIKVLHHVAGRLGQWTAASELLYGADGGPKWLEHPLHGPNVDVVALPLTATAGFDFYGYDLWGADQPIAVGVTKSLFVIGFPFAITGGGALGVWVQGTVATEPQIDWQGVPAFLIDSRTRLGQSGSPVIAFHTGGAVAMEGGGTVLSTGQQERFVGVYSGRINSESDLGIVWKKTAVMEIIEGGRAGTA